MKKLLLIVILTSFISCRPATVTDSNNISEEQIAEDYETDIEKLFPFRSKDTLSFEDLIYKSNRYNLPILESEMQKNWTQDIMPKEIYKLQLYTTLCYSIQDRLENFSVLSLITLADDWTKMHLITIDPLGNLIAHYEVGEDISHLIDQDDEMETYDLITSKAIRIEKNKYYIVQKTETVYNFFSAEKQDSIVTHYAHTKILINEIGQFTKTE